jgi:glycosyltransferase involved in cell wall biosynthesis
MKVLYVTGLCDPIKDILTGKTEREVTHSPGFFYPWYKLVQRGHQVDFVVASNFNEPYDIRVDWFRPENIYANVYDPFLEAPWYRRIPRLISRFIRLFYYTDRALRENHYDFVYCKAFNEGLVGNIVANLHGVPSGMRSMGTMLYDDFERYGSFGTAIRRPVEYLTFKLSKAFFIMTDDGTKGDLVYEAWKPRPEKYPYLFWKTGVAIKSIDDLESDVVIPDHDYLFFAARFDRWKRHDRIVRILEGLHKRGRMLHLYLAGPVQTPTYHDEIRSLVRQLGLEDYVHFLGPINQDDLRRYAYHAVANPLMYNVSNLGNVFFETFSTGAVILGLDDGSLDDYIDDTCNGFIVRDEMHAISVVESILDGLVDRAEVRRLAIQTARKRFLSLEERFDMEVDLIERTAQGVGS